ncbi:MAG: hypothetical protein JW749_05595 [Sedimentisphaerales bacterium]|nr:hypothetical protein [Sedimentisphaerales bacterium]
MARICLVACVSLKDTHKKKAGDIYLSPLFKKAKEFANKNFDRWYILSAKYGLIAPNKLIEPYEKTLNTMPREDRHKWTEKVFEEIKTHTKANDEITFIAGTRYRQGLTPLLLKRGNKVQVPMEGLGIGKQLQWLTQNNINTTRNRHLEEFYGLLNDLEKSLGGKHLFKNCNGKLSWPERGVYFFFEPGEFRANNKNEYRVVRVGTHMVSKGSKATLWNRLKTHRGTEDGGGNHRASVFRLHVGDAIIKKSAGKISIPSWGKSELASKEIQEAELELEKKVSEYIGNMSILWLNVPDIAGPASDRAFIEKNSIGLLSGPTGPVDKQSDNWLGNYSPNEAIRKSGLWNVNHVDYSYDQRFLSIFAKYIDAMAGRSPMHKNSIAPKDWYTADKGKDARGQTFLFEEDENE